MVRGLPGVSDETKVLATGLLGRVGGRVLPVPVVKGVRGCVAVQWHLGGHEHELWFYPSGEVSRVGCDAGGCLYSFLAGRGIATRVVESTADLVEHLARPG